KALVAVFKKSVNDYFSSDFVKSTRVFRYCFIDWFARRSAGGPRCICAGCGNRFNPVVFWFSRRLSKASPLLSAAHNLAGYRPSGGGDDAQCGCAIIAHRLKPYSYCVDKKAEQCYN